jgi:hypothetical protein
MLREKVQAQKREAESTDALIRDGLPSSSDDAEQCPRSEGGRSSTSCRVNWRQDELGDMAEGDGLRRMARAG